MRWNDSPNSRLPNPAILRNFRRRRHDITNAKNLHKNALPNNNMLSNNEVMAKFTLTHIVWE